MGKCSTAQDVRSRSYTNSSGEDWCSIRFATIWNAYSSRYLTKPLLNSHSLAEPDSHPLFMWESGSVRLEQPLFLNVDARITLPTPADIAHELKCMFKKTHDTNQKGVGGELCNQIDWNITRSTPWGSAHSLHQTILKLTLLLSLSFIL